MGSQFRVPDTVTGIFTETKVDVRFVETIGEKFFVESGAELVVVSDWKEWVLKLKNTLI